MSVKTHSGFQTCMKQELKICLYVDYMLKSYFRSLGLNNSKKNFFWPHCEACGNLNSRIRD